MFHTLGAVKNAIGVGEDEPELRIQTERELVGNCQRVIAATEREKEELISHYDASPETITVIPCGVNLDLFQPVDRVVARRQLGFDGNNIVLFVGRVEPLKGIDKLLVAMSYLDDRQRARLVVIGGDGYQPEVERLQRLSQELRIEDSVTFIGTVAQEDLSRYYSAADICVIPSYYESFGLVALESLACGTPIVATRVGGIESVIGQGETGYMVMDNSPFHLADKIAALLSKSNNGTEAAGSIRAAVASFSWANIAEVIAKEYKVGLRHYTARIG